ncbi:NlpC/P60 family protein [Clostridium cavendishii DSM 21758]|uniref:NlpC/P60 family protein n=1 Tax=Clostridium cavendishii DSM 21758 TaxID=1121302 RepID=A0A1M6NE27_9CLOT|nr:NlpC/P60 family protein [Clostridium cavendishii]SHJ93950.1 NlpC/P60 family protein [Clostridium cavendishii DSM 21758]
MKRKRINIKIIVFTIMMLCTIVMPCFSRQAFAVGTASDIINEAKKHLGKPYVKGGNGPNVFDCSGFTKYVFGQVGYNLSRTTYTQINEGQAISRSELKPGDLVFERGTAAVPEHVGIYIGNGQIIHAANPDDGVKIGSIYEYVAARRIIKDTPVAPPAPINPYESIDKVIFDADFYAQRNQDLKWLGNDYNALYEHWQEHGKKEGRAPSAVFDPNYYAVNNSDVKATYGNNWQAVYEHFVIDGYKQNRKSSPVFDMEFYKNANPDLKGLGSDLGFLEHFIKHGMNEGRQASKNFDPKAYAERYSDLKNEYGTNYKLYFNQYLLSGLNFVEELKCISYKLSI